MTWLKLSDDFHDECAELSDAAYRTHVEALGWVMRRETAGLLSRRDVRRCLETPDPDTAVDELLERGFWQREGDGYRILHHMEHQPEPEVLRRRRELAAERQRKVRRKQAGLADPARSRRDITRDTTRDPGRDGTGRDGTVYQGDDGSAPTTESERESDTESEGDAACPSCKGDGCSWCRGSGVDPYAAAH